MVRARCRSIGSKVRNSFNWVATPLLSLQTYTSYKSDTVSVAVNESMPGELLTEKPAASADSEASGGEEQAAEGAAEQKTKKPEAPASKAVVGIIYPPPEVRSIHSTRYSHCS